MTDALNITEASVCVERIAAHQAEFGLSDLELVRKFPLLGSSRTWRSRLAAEDWAAAPLDVWLPKLIAVVAKIEGRELEPETAPGAVPTACVSRHLIEADRCRREKHLPLARSHCRAARQAIEQFQRSLS